MEMEECGCCYPNEFEDHQYDYDDESSHNIFNKNEIDDEIPHNILNSSERYENEEEEDDLNKKEYLNEISQNKNDKIHKKEKNTEGQLNIKKEISLQESTGPNTKRKQSSQNQEKIKISLQKKNNEKVKGFRPDTMMRRIIVNLCKDINTLVYDLKKKSKKLLKIYVKKINKEAYINSKAQDNINFLEKKLKYVLSEVDEKNEEIIKIIMLENDYPPLFEVLEKTMNELHEIHCGNVIVTEKEDYYNEFIQGYQNFIDKVKQEKNTDYMKEFTKYSKNLLNEFKKINEHAKNKKKKIIKK